MEANGRVRGAVGAQQMQQLRELRFKYGSLHEPRRQYVAGRGANARKKEKHLGANREGRAAREGASEGDSENAG